MSLYEDEEVCKIFNCEFFKSFQFISRVINKKVTDYDDFSKSFRYYIYQYLNDETSIDEALKNIDDITRIYYFSIKPEDTYVGLIIFIIFSISLIIMVASISFLFIDKFKSCLNFLPFDFTLLNIMGSITLLLRGFTEFGKINLFICHSKPILLSIGISLSLGPVLYKLLVYFPEQNKFSIWLVGHRWLFMSSILLIDVILNSLTIIDPYTIVSEIDENNKNYEVCIMKTTFINFIANIIMVLKFIMVLIIILLLFLEWNIKKLHYDIKYILSTISINIICIIILFTIDFINKNDYIFYFSIYSGIFIISGISNFIFLYFIKIISFYIKSNDEELVLASSLRNQFNSTNDSKCIDSNYRSNYRAGKVSSKMLSYHYKESISNSKITDDDSSIQNIQNESYNISTSSN